MQKNKLMKGNKLRGHQAHLTDVAASFKRDQTLWDKLSKLTSKKCHLTSIRPLYI